MIKNKKTFFKGIELTLSNRKYFFLFLALALVFFSGLYYFLVDSVANNDIQISIMMSGSLSIFLSLIFILFISLLSSVLFCMILFKFNNYRKIEKKGFFGFILSGIGAFGVGCPTCGAFLFGLLGFPLALMYLPFRGLELQFLGVIILIISIYFTDKSIYSTCKLKYNKTKKIIK